MKILTMKKVDRWAGYPACGLLDLVERFRAKPPAGKVERVLVIKFWGMGSIVLAVPAFRALRETFPGAQIAFATIGSNREFAEMLKISDQQISPEPALQPARGLGRNNFLFHAPRAIPAGPGH